jgi:hypothetical protein
LESNPDPDDWVGVPLDDDLSRVAFVPGADVAVTYMPWTEGGVLFVDLIEPIPVPPFPLPPPYPD